MDQRNKQKIAGPVVGKFLLNLFAYVQYEIKCAITFEMLTVSFGKSTMSGTQVQLWYNRFKEGRKDVNNDARPMKTLKQ